MFMGFSIKNCYKPSILYCRSISRLHSPLYLHSLHSPAIFIVLICFIICSPNKNLPSTCELPKGHLNWWWLPEPLAIISTPRAGKGWRKMAAKWMEHGQIWPDCQRIAWILPGQTDKAYPPPKKKQWGSFIEWYWMRMSGLEWSPRKLELRKL